MSIHAITHGGALKASQTDSSLYIVGTLHYGLQFDKYDRLDITTFCDADW